MNTKYKRIILGASIVGAFSLILGMSLSIEEDIRDFEYIAPYNGEGVIIDDVSKETGPVFYPATYSGEPSNETYYSNQNSWTFTPMNYKKAVWDTYRGDSVKVAVIDSGLNYTHEDFISGGNQIIEGHSRTIEYASGSWKYYQFDYSSANAAKINDTLGHGTNVASVIASQLNAVGCAGIAPNVELYVYKVTNSNNGYEWTAINNALQYCIDEGMDVVNMSFQAYEHDVEYNGSSMAASSGCSSVLTTKLNACYNAGITLVAAAGNFNTSEPSYPASNNHVISVGSLAKSSTTTKAGYSNTYGVDIVAPGSVYVANIGGNSAYKETQGTSFSSPIVTAAIALYKQKYPTATPDQIEAALKQSADKLAGLPSWAGAGRLNVAKFLEIDPYPTSITLDNVTNNALTLTEGDKFQLNWTVNGIGNFDDSVEFEVLGDLVSVDANGLITALDDGDELLSITSSVDSFISETITITIEKATADKGETKSISNSDFTSSSYNTSEASKTCASGLQIKYLQLLKSNSVIQFKASSGLLYNSASLNLHSLVINGKGGSGSFAVYGGSSSKPTSTVITPVDGVYDLYGYNYFTVKNSSSTNMVSCSSIDVSLVAPSSISINTNPTKLSYTSGEYFDPSGLKINVNYSGTNQVVTYSSGNASEFTFSPTLTTALTSSVTLVTVTYASRSTSVYITVTDPVSLSSISISGYTTSFVEGDTFSFGGTVTAHFSDSSSSNVTSSATFTGYNMTNVSQQTVTVSYTYQGTTKTQTYNITVGAGTLSSITLTGQTTNYIQNQAFSFTGTCTANFANGYSKSVTPTSVSSVDTSVLGDHTVTVSFIYNGNTRTANYTITVSEQVVLSKIEFVDLPTSVPYMSELDLSETKVKATLSDGTVFNDVKSSCTITNNVDTSVLGSQSITASYTYEGVNKTTTGYVKVTNNGASGNVGITTEEEVVVTEDSAHTFTASNDKSGSLSKDGTFSVSGSNGYESDRGLQFSNVAGTITISGISGSAYKINSISAVFSGNCAYTATIKVGTNEYGSWPIAKGTNKDTKTAAVNLNGGGTISITTSQGSKSAWVKTITVNYTKTTITPGESYPASPDDQAKAWATYFLAQIKPECNNSGVGSDIENIVEKWSVLADEYGHMKDISKDAFVSSSDSSIMEAIELYQLIRSKYSVSHEALTNFITNGNNDVALAEVVHTYFSPLNSETISIVLIIVISVIAITSIVGYVYISNRRGKNK